MFLVIQAASLVIPDAGGRGHPFLNQEIQIGPIMPGQDGRQPPPGGSPLNWPPGQPGARSGGNPPVEPLP